MAHLSPNSAMDRIEVVKENVQPVKRGRDAGRAALGAVGGVGGGLAPRALVDSREQEKQ